MRRLQDSPAESAVRRRLKTAFLTANRRPLPPVLPQTRFFAAVLFWAALSAFVYGSAAHTKTAVIRTAYFDIIYPAPAEHTAQLLAEHADRLLEKAAAALGVRIDPDVYRRLPVTITQNNDTLNAFYTPLPYNRIVLYDTLPDQQLAVYEETLLSVFYHELVHAVTANIKSPVFKTLSAVFSDALSPSLVYNMPTSLTEGIAVALESADGYGRLNDGFSRQLITQAKIENLFPTFKEAAGARDIYPAGTIPYLFGGAFMAWLQQRYGMEKCVEFWHRGGNFYLIYGSAGIFKRVYGFSIEQAWQEFYDAVPIPEAVIDPSANNGFTRLSIDTLSKQRPVSLSAGAHRIAWIDEASNSVWYAHTDGALLSKPERLCGAHSAERAALSHDGRLLALSYSRSIQQPTGSMVSRRYAAVYDVEKRRCIYAPSQRLRDAAITRAADGSLQLAAVSVQGQQAQLVFYSIGQKEPLARIAFPCGALPYSPIDSSPGKTAFLLRYHGAVFFCVADSDAQTYQAWPVPHSGVNISSIAPADTGEGRAYLFSWTRADTLPRLGRAELTENGRLRWEFSRADISGGVHTPAIAAGAQTLVYSAHFYENNALIQAPLAVLFAESDTAETARTVLEPPAPSAQTAQFAGARYNPFAYITRGTLVPLGTVPYYTDTLTQTSLALLGLTWVSLDPAETLLFGASAGWDPFTRTGGAGISLFSGIPQLFAAVSASALFGSEGFEQSYLSFKLTSTHLLGRHSTFTLYNLCDWYAGRPSYAGTAAYIRTQPVHTVREFLQATYSLSQQWGAGRHEVLGFSVSAFLLAVYRTRFNVLSTNTGANIAVMLPRLLPFRNPDKLTLTLPVSISAALFPSLSTAMEASVSVTLISAEIQKALAVLPLYAKYIDVQLSYRGYFAYNCRSWEIVNIAEIFPNRRAAPYYDEIRLRTQLSLALTATTATGAGANIGVDISWRPRRPPFEKPFAASLVFELGY